MKWFAAHVILAARYQDGRQVDFPIWENVYLIRAKDGSLATRMAKEMGRKFRVSDPTMTINGRLAKWVYCGVSAIVECTPAPASRKSILSTGTELTCLEY